MRLQEWMEKTDIDVFEAARAFGVSIHGIRKWLRRERIPRSKMQAKINRVTKGAVTPNDWISKEA